MFKILELIGLLAPVVGGVLVLRYRRRSRRAFALGIAACVLGSVASLIAVVELRVSVGATYLDGGGMEGVSHGLDSWAVIRFGLLLIAIALLVVAASVDRAERWPVGWIVVGLTLAIAGFGLHFAEVDLDAGHDRLTRILTVLLEIGQSGVLGLGFLALCVASIAYRGGGDGRREPTELAKNAGAAAWRIYSESRRRGRE